MNRKLMKKFAFVTLLAAFLAGCGGDDGLVGTGAGPKIKIAGAVQKGPFVIGSRVTIGRLLEAGSQSSTDAVITTTGNDLGDFTAEMAEAGSFEIIADGYHFNELTGGLSQGTLLLRAVYFADADSSRKADVNLLTHLIHGRILFLMRAGSTAAVAEAQARAEMLTALTPVFRIDQLPEFTSLSLYNVNATSEIGNAYLLALSATAYQYATTKATSNKTSIDAELTLLINSLADDFTKDATINMAGVIDGLIAASRLLNADTIVENLKQRSIEAVGEALPVPDISIFLDTDGDGKANSTDVDDDGDSVPDSIDPFPYGRDNYQLIVTEDKYRNMTQDTPLTAEFTFQHAIAKVEYFIQGELIGSAATPPYRVDWNPYFWSDIPPYLNHKLLIRVTSNFGATYDYPVSVYLDWRTGIDSYTPESGTVLRNTAQPVVIWSAIAGAAYYEIEVSLGRDGLTTYSQVLSTAATSIQLPKLPFSGEYFWKIRAANENRNFGPWRVGNTFIISGPDAPTLLTPTGLNVATNSAVEFSWAPVEFATYYVLYSKPNLDSPPPIYVRITATSISLTLEPGIYEWTLEAFDANGFKSDSTTWHLNAGVFFQNNLYGFHANAIQETLDGDFILAGTTDASEFATDALLTRLDGVGATAWQATLTPVDEYPDTAFDVKVTPDGGFLITGSTMSLNNHTSPDLYLMKTDGAGSRQWVKLYSGVCPCIDAKVKLTDFGATVMARAAGNNFVVGVDTEGRKLWSKTLLTTQIATGAHAATSMQKSSDGGYVLFGDYAGVALSNHPYIVKLGTNGITEWVATTGSGRFRDIKDGFQTVDGGYIVVGTDTLPTASLLKVNAQGAVSWLRSIVEPYGLTSQTTFTPATSVPLLEMPDGGFVNFSTTSGEYSSSMLLRLDGVGQIKTSLNYAYWGTPVAVIRSTDGGFVMLANGVDTNFGVNTRPIIVKTDRNGVAVYEAYVDE